MSNSSAAARSDDGPRIGRPPGADADRTRTAILDAALAAFAERGFDGASIREITGSIGVGHNLVRHYFGSKDDLFHAAVRHGLRPITERIVAMLEQRDGQPMRLTLRVALEAIMVEAGANPDAFRLFLAEALRGGERFDRIYDEVLAPIARALFGYAASTPELSPDLDLRVAGVYVFGAVFSPFTFEGFASRVGIEPPVPGDALSQSMDQLIEMIVAGLSIGN